MIKTYFLPKEFRPEIKKIWGIPIFGRKKEVSEKFKEFCQKRKFKKIITVGDYCSLNLPSDIKIFDGKINRRKIKLPFKWYKNHNLLYCSNPPGTIQDKVWPKIEKAIKEKRNLFIDGEEDLLVIPTVLLSPQKTVVVYGFFKKGVCLIEVCPRVKKTFKELLENFSSKCGR